MPSRPLGAFALAAIGLLSLLSGADRALAGRPAASKISVDTPALGRLELENGYPSAPTARKLYDALDLQRATQSYLWALPAVGFKALYDAQAKTMGVRNGDVLLYRTLQDKAGMLTPNITLYDNLSRGPLITPQGAADLSSRKPELVTNADGSVDVDFGPVRPAGATNWIQTTPGKGWFAYFRFYGPTEPYFAKTWQLNDITPIKP